MKYELAKELKDAGFPQKGGRWSLGIVYLPEKRKETKTGTYLRREEYRTFPWINVDSFKIAAYETILLPNLSELIEACGEGFENLERDTTTEKIIWVCNNYLPENHPTSTIDWFEGPTPEEAVAQLWLALNKTKSPTKG